MYETSFHEHRGSFASSVKFVSDDDRSAVPDIECQSIWCLWCKCWCDRERVDRAKTRDIDWSGVESGHVDGLCIIDRIDIDRSMHKGRSFEHLKYPVQWLQ